MAMAEISVIPLGTKTPSASNHVARAVKALQGEKDIKYEISSMGTIIEGDLDKLLTVIKKMHEATFSEEVARVVTVVRIDERRDRKSSMSEKVSSLMRKL